MEASKIIIYDFEGTLTPYLIPKFEILEKCGMNGININKFYLQVIRNAISRGNNLYQVLYETYFEIIRKAGLSVNDINLCLGYDDVIYNKGVYEFLSGMKMNGIKNYLLSSGIKVFLDKVSISSLFEDIYGTTFNYDGCGEVCGIEYLMSDINKVDTIKEIILLNNYKEDDCSNIIYIGDGLTDMYAMEYVKENGGNTILVYSNKISKYMITVLNKDIVDCFTTTDFSLDSNLDRYVKRLCRIK